MFDNKIMGNRMERDQRVRTFISPTRIVWKSTTGINGEDGLVSQKIAECKMLRNPGAEAPGILLDFGCELHGGLRIECPNNSEFRPAKFRVRFGESVSEAMGEPNNDHAVHDFEAQVPAMGYTELGCTGFRFVRLDLLEEGIDVELNAIKAVAIYHDVPYLGSFECNDERLNEIWKVGARTVHLCLQDHLWDGIKRDRLVWIGDIHPETRVVSAVFGKLDVVEKSLDYARDKYALPTWMNGISSYSLWWVITHADWYRYHGDMAYLTQQKEYLLGLLEVLMQNVDSDGQETLGEVRFLDWPASEDKDAVSAGLQALLILALKAGSELCTALGEDSIAKKVSDCAKLAASYKKPASTRKSPNALMVLAETVSAKETNKALLSVDQLRDVSVFYGYYVLQARAKAGDYLGCLEVIRNCWGGMLDLGATSFWESFDLDWKEGAAGITELVPEGMKDIHADFGEYCYKGLRHSLCHGWSAGPTAWLTEHVLGLSPLEPGFKVVKVAPNLVDLRWARGTIPTPSGVIEVVHEAQSNGEVKTNISAPDGIKIIM